MAIFQLSDELVFPPPGYWDDQGLIAVGGDLSPERLLLAYSSGLFPWFSDGDPILWWSPNPRLVLFPNAFRLTKSLRQVIRSGKYTIRFDTDFDAVITHCAMANRKDQDGSTWITKGMKKAYRRLHQLGFAHSVEAWQGNQLAGGLYGISLGKVFFGESMFHIGRDASKVALFHLVEKLKEWDFHFIDSQQSTSHLISLGAVEISRKEFLERLSSGMCYPTHTGRWSDPGGDGKKNER